MHICEILWNFLLFYPKNISTIILTKLYFIQNILQDLCFFVFVSGPIITILMASSKTAFRPFWLSAEHSRYFWMWIVGFLDCRVLTRLLAYKYSTLHFHFSKIHYCKWPLSQTPSPGSCLSASGSRPGPPSCPPWCQPGWSGSRGSGESPQESTWSWHYQNLLGWWWQNRPGIHPSKGKLGKLLPLLTIFVPYSLRIWQWSKSVIVILACCIP